MNATRLSVHLSPFLIARKAVSTGNKDFGLRGSEKVLQQLFVLFGLGRELFVWERLAPEKVWHHDLGATKTGRKDIGSLFGLRVVTENVI